MLDMFYVHCVSVYQFSISSVTDRVIDWLWQAIQRRHAANRSASRDSTKSWTTWNDIRRWMRKLVRSYHPLSSQVNSDDHFPHLSVWRKTCAFTPWDRLEVPRCFFWQECTVHSEP